MTANANKNEVIPRLCLPGWVTVCEFDRGQQAGLMNVKFEPNSAGVKFEPNFEPNLATDN